MQKKRDLFDLLDIEVQKWFSHLNTQGLTAWLMATTLYALPRTKLTLLFGLGSLLIFLLLISQEHLAPTLKTLRNGNDKTTEQESAITYIDEKYYRKLKCLWYGLPYFSGFGALLYIVLFKVIP